MTSQGSKPLDDSSAEGCSGGANAVRAPSIGALADDGPLSIAVRASLADGSDEGMPKLRSLHSISCSTSRASTSIATPCAWLPIRRVSSAVSCCSVVATCSLGDDDALCDGSRGELTDMI